MKWNFLNMGTACVCGLLLSFTAACSSDDNEQEQRADGRKLRQLTISEVPVTRATLTDNTSALGAAWKAGDRATYFNVTSFSYPYTMDYGALTASSSAKTSTFTGPVICQANDYIALFYPYQEIPIQTNRGKFTVNLNEQDGTLETIAKKFHYVYGVAKVTSVTETTANATINDMKSLLAVCKFIFKDEDDTVIPVQKLTINYYENSGIYSSTLGYPLSATLEPTSDVSNLALTYPEQEIWEDQELTITLASETSSGVYVALFPSSGFPDYMHFSVTGSSGTYTGTAKATLKAGKYYPVELKLN